MENSIEKSRSQLVKQLLHYLPTNMQKFKSHFMIFERFPMNQINLHPND